MKTCMLRHDRRRTVGRHARRGVAVVEMAVVTPLLLLIMFGIIEFGWVFMIQETLTNATREAARVAALQGSTDADIQTRFAQAVQPTGLTISPGMLQITHATVANPVETVRVVIPYSQVSLLGQYLHIDINRNIGAACSMRKEGQL